MSNISIISRGCYHIDNENAKCKCTGGKLDVYDWLNETPKAIFAQNAVEVQFKNTRKGFYRNVNDLDLQKGDIVAVEASPGHDIGIVSLTGELVVQQMMRMGMTFTAGMELKKVYRKAKSIDIEKWLDAISQEHEVMLQARDIASCLNLLMKIGDVEFQGDRTKAIFYYIANERVDFRELIKLLADRFKIRVEMRQIGARQEAGRIGGIGSCGRELCCATWMSNFRSVATLAARMQELSLNPSKLAGQCGKLKCCLNYELDSYVDARNNIPSSDTRIKTKEGVMFCQKIDIFKATMWFSQEPNSAVNMVALPVNSVWELIELNNKGIEVENINLLASMAKDEVFDYRSVIGEESLTRFDNLDKEKRKKKRSNKQRRKNPQKQNKKNSQKTNLKKQYKAPPKDANKSKGNEQNNNAKQEQIKPKKKKHKRKNKNTNRNQKYNENKSNSK